MPFIDKLKEIVGEGNWTTDPHELEPHVTEWRDTWRGNPLLMVSPGSTADVAAVVRVCHETRTAIVPQGGNTGLCGGAIPDQSGQQILLSLSRLNQVRSLEAENYSMIAESGCTLSALQEAAARENLFFPLSLSAEGSCQIGGNLSTNAGGINVLRYGTARGLALGLEVVLADGTVWDGLRSLRKDNAGYDMKQCFIGAEGTLGVITAASLRLFPAVKDAQTALVSLTSPAQAVRLLARLRDGFADQIQAFELMSERAIRFVTTHIPSCSFPLKEKSPWFVLMEVADLSSPDRFESELAAAMENGLISDAVIAKNRGEADSLWRIRHSISEAQKQEGASLKHDVAVPVDKVGDLISRASEAAEAYLEGIRVVAFGHVGDGNIHFNLTQPRNSGADEFLARREPLASLVYDVVSALGGSFSAEHGIGQAKKADLVRYRGAVEINLMRRIKEALDPHNIMNPGKVI